MLCITTPVARIWQKHWSVNSGFCSPIFHSSNSLTSGQMNCKFCKLWHILTMKKKRTTTKHTFNNREEINWTRPNTDSVMTFALKHRIKIETAFLFYESRAVFQAIFSLLSVTTFASSDFWKCSIFYIFLHISIFYRQYHIKNVNSSSKSFAEKNRFSHKIISYFFVWFIDSNLNLWYFILMMHKMRNIPKIVDEKFPYKLWYVVKISSFMC